MSDVKPSEIAPTSSPLRADDLATRINAANEEVKNSIRRGAEYAIKAGQLLLQAKETVGHGVFLEWVGEHCHCTPRTAQLYMKLAKEKDKLGSNTKSISHLTLTEAMEKLGPLKQKLPEPKPSKPPPPDPVAEAIKQNALDILRRAWAVAEERQEDIHRLHQTRQRCATELSRHVGPMRPQEHKERARGNHSLALRFGEAIKQTV